MSTCRQLGYASDIRTLLFVKFIKHSNNTTWLVPWEIYKLVKWKFMCFVKRGVWVETISFTWLPGFNVLCVVYSLLHNDLIHTKTTKYSNNLIKPKLLILEAWAWFLYFLMSIFFLRLCRADSRGVWQLPPR